MASPERRDLWLVGFPWMLILLFTGLCCCQTNPPQQQQPLVGFNSMVSSVRYPNRWLPPHDSTYLRVELPPWFFALTVTLLSDMDVEEKVENIGTAVLPILCFRDGGLPLPDFSDDSLKGLTSSFIFNGSSGGYANQRLVEQCFPFKKNFTLTLTNEQITSGVWYIGYFNGLGPERTQSKMIRRGRSHKFSTSIDISGCTNPFMWGQHCNQTIVIPFCVRTGVDIQTRSVLETLKQNRTYLKHLSNAEHSVIDHPFLLEQNVYDRISRKQFDNGSEYPRRSMLAPSSSSITCTSSTNISCLRNGHPKIYSLDIAGPTSFFNIVATEIIFNNASAANINATEGIHLMCYARKDAFPSKTLYDKLSDISTSPMFIPSPAIGRWYIMISAINQTKVNNVFLEVDQYNDICFSFEWQVLECPFGKAGPNCMWESYKLKRILGDGNVPFGSYYVPNLEAFTDSSHFPLESLLSNSSINSTPDVGWTYFLLDVPPGAGGSNIHIKLTSNRNLNYEVYSKFGSLPSIDDWDYYASSTNNSNNPMLLAVNKNDPMIINFYVLYPKEGTWSFGIKHMVSKEFNAETFLSISLEACPVQCSSHGTCDTFADESGAVSYGICSCHRSYGGFDCSVVLVSPTGHMWQSIFLIASNGAAILPAYWALRRRALAEWVIFSSSGISSGLYHACDVGTWCILGFHVLQFMDFWLSFMAVVSTYVYLTSISESHKRAIITAFSVFTALLAANGPTRPRNIVLVIAIGAVGLILGWLIEILSSYRNSRRNLSFFNCCNFHIRQRFQNARRWPRNIINLIHTRFRWPFILLGCITLTAAGISWKLETSQSYWIWHSIWHLTIYTSSFFFLCSARVMGNQETQVSEHELARQNSATRTEQNDMHC